MNKLIRAVQVITYKSGQIVVIYKLCEKVTQLKKTSYMLTDNSSTEQPGSCICQCPQCNTWDSLRPPSSFSNKVKLKDRRILHFNHRTIILGIKDPVQ